MQPEQAFATAVLVLLSITAVGVLGGIIYAFKKSLFDFKAGELE
jgi:hypothetical protein